MFLDSYLRSSAILCAKTPKMIHNNILNSFEDVELEVDNIGEFYYFRRIFIKMKSQLDSLHIKNYRKYE